MGPARYVTSQRKVRGFQQALLARDDGADPGATAEVVDDLVVHSVYSVEGGQAATEALLERGVSAVVCGSDLMALGAIRAVRGQGLQVPRDVSVTGYDDSPLIAFTDPPVTTMRQNVPAMSQHAVAALLDEIRGTPQPRRELLFHTELVVRRSTGPARAGAASVAPLTQAR
jgi:DNA-binding LacI/PurR family transcriptional regulator